MSLVEDWFASLESYLKDDLLVTDVRVGVFYTAVEITSGDVGVAFTPRDLQDTVCCPKSAAGAPPAGHLIGMKAWETAKYAWSPSALRRAIGVATLNALSNTAVRRFGLAGVVIEDGLDALEAAAISPSDIVVLVGAFTPFIKKLKGKVSALKIVDKHLSALKEDEVSFYVPPESAKEALSEASVVIISGSALVEGGVENLIEWSSRARVRVMAGPTTPLWPYPLFQRGVSILGGIRPIAGRELLTIVSQGGSGYLFEQAARKVSIIDPSYLHSTSLAALH